jgi:hypothetical protein
MRWTPEAIAELRELAHLGRPVLAEHFGISANAISHKAGKENIHLGRHPTRDASPQEWRARWESYLPAMKARLVEDILRDQSPQRDSNSAV